MSNNIVQFNEEIIKGQLAELKTMKLPEAAKKIEAGIEETLTYCDFPSEHWTKIRTNNVIERMNREIRRRTRVVGAFPDGNSALMPGLRPAASCGGDAMG